MEITQVPFEAIQWSTVSSVEYAGLSGKAFWKTVEVGNLRIRLVEYTPGYLADHWCDRGHVVLVLEGELTTELADGRTFLLKKGMSFHVANGAQEAHRSSSVPGARLFIVD